MKITVDVDMTPEELRKLFGLPDVAGFNQQLMDDIRARMTAGAEGYDPSRLFSTYMNGTMASWDMFQKLLGNMTTAGSGRRRDGDSPGAPEEHR